MKKLLLLSFVLVLFVGCSTEQDSNQAATFNGESIFVEFMPCQAGPDSVSYTHLTLPTKQPV